jgi:hypothetical protein
LTHGTYPPKPTKSADTQAPNRADLPGRARLKTTKAKKPPRTSATKASPNPNPNPHLAVAEDVLAQTLAAGGWVDLGKVDIEPHRVLAAARSASNLPHDQILRFDSYGGWYDQRHIAYLEENLSLLVARSSVPVPARVVRPHPAVAAYKADEDRHLVTNGSLTRAIRLLQGLVAEAERRGHKVKAKKYGQLYAAEFRQSLSRGHLDITVDNFAYGITIAEKGGKGGGRRDYSQHDMKKAPRWLEVRQYNFVPTGQLSITIVALGTSRDGRPLTFADSARSTLEERLGDVLWEIEVRALEDTRSALKAQAVALEKQRRWENAMSAAKTRLVASQRLKVLDRQASAWTQTNLRRDYVKAMAAAVWAMPAGEDRDRAEAWVTWCTDNINFDDPLRRPLAMPTTPEPTAKNLEPFLDGWSPYGPDGNGHR